MMSERSPAVRREVHTRTSWVRRRVTASLKASRTHPPASWVKIGCIESWYWTLGVWMASRALGET